MSTQAELIATVAGITGQSKATVEHILKTAGDVACDELAAGRDVPLPGIGKLAAKHKKARTARNPKTGEPIEIPAKWSAKFTAGKQLRDALAQS